MFFGDKVNENVVVEKKSFEPLPEGWYKANVEACEYKTTQKGGGMIAITFNIMGQERVHKVFENFNIRNESAQTEGFAREALRSLESASGLPKCTDTDQYIGAICDVKLAIKKDSEYGDKNVVKGYRKSEGTIVNFDKVKTNPFGK